MNVGTLSLRYAEALYKYAKELKAEAAVYRNMLQLKDVLRNMKDLPVMLKNPSKSNAEKVHLLCSMVDAPSQAFERFASLVIKAAREDMLLYMVYSYINIYREDKKVVAIKLTTATPLRTSLQEKIERLVENLGGNEVEIKNIVDNSIIGGFVCEANNTRLDASVTSQLAEIKKNIVKTNKKIV